MYVYLKQQVCMYITDLPKASILYIILMQVCRYVFLHYSFVFIVTLTVYLSSLKSTKYQFLLIFHFLFSILTNCICMLFELLP